MSDATVEIYRSARRPKSDERAFVLAAVGIRNEVVFDGAEFLLRVDQEDAERALDHLRQYEIESRNRPPPPPPRPRLHPNAWLGSAIYALVLVSVAAAIANGVWRLDAFDVGELDAARVQSGQWWRVWTALTLHLDGAHLFANTLAGIWFGYLAARLMGVGNAWFLVVLGAGVANWIEGHFGPASHRAVGASTAVFTALGLLSAYSWRTRLRYPQRWASRWGPLIAGVILLGWTGTGGESLDNPSGAGQTVDVVAHGLGFTMGLLLGAVAAAATVGRVLDRLPQWLVGFAALVPVGIAWGFALTS
jgi:rhomboid protease GluP